MSGPIVLGLRLLLALALYSFLGAALWIIWRNLRQEGWDIANRRTPGIRLELRSRGGNARPYQFFQPEILLGRDQGCQIMLKDETVSARHAKLSFHHGHWWVEDLGSRNGTRLNKQKLKTATVLTTGDEIACGKARLAVDLGSNALPQR